MKTPVVLIEPLMTADAVAAALGLSKQTLRRAWHSSLFPAPIRVGRRSLRWRVADIEQWISDQIKKGETPHVSNRATTPTRNRANLQDPSTGHAAVQ